MAQERMAANSSASASRTSRPEYRCLWFLRGALALSLQQDLAFRKLGSSKGIYNMEFPVRQVELIDDVDVFRYNLPC
jgi:hypothetical protein